MDKRISITSFVKIARNRAKIARLFSRETDKVLLTVNKTPRYSLMEYVETAKLTTAGTAAKIINSPGGEVITVGAGFLAGSDRNALKGYLQVRSEDRAPYNAHSTGQAEHYRFFTSKYSEVNLERQASKGVKQIPITIIPVPDYLVDADPERYADLVEVKF